MLNEVADGTRHLASGMSVKRRARLTWRVGGGLSKRRGRASPPAPLRVDVERPHLALHHLRPDHHLLYRVKAGQVVHGVEEDALHDGAQAPCPGLALDRLAGD